MDINDQRTQHAAKVLGVSEDHRIAYLANTEFRFLLDTDYLVDELADDDETVPIRTDSDGLHDAFMASSVSVKLPGSLRLVGMAKPGSDERVYGVVDFTGLI